MLLFVSLIMLSFIENKSYDPPTSSEVYETETKEFLLNYFQKTTEDLQDRIAGLSTAQMQFKPSAEEWSVSQVLEHIILTEKMLFEMMKEQMKKPANTERRSEIQVTDDQVLAGITDRSSKVKASDELQGKGKYTTPEAAMEDMISQRQMILEYIGKTTTKELRNRVNDSPFGAVDAYQGLLFIAGHTARHTLQIEEIKADEGFPSE